MSTPHAIRILVGSRSAMKLSAVEGGASKSFPGRAVEVVGCKGVSLVNEQPVGHEETVQGAVNRMTACREALEEGAHTNETETYLLCIENGIVETLPGEWYDVAWVVLETQEGVRVKVHSLGVPFPARCVEEAKGRGFAKCTAGQVMAEAGLVTTHDDPHVSLTAGVLKRSELLTEAVRAAFGLLFKRKEQSS